MVAVKKKHEEGKSKTVTRKVFFYRINAGVHPDTGQPRKIAFGPLFRQLQALPFSSGAEGRYLDTVEGKQLCCWPDSVAPPYRIRLANIRRGQYPPVENGGTFTPLILGAGKGLAEITHLVLFTDSVCGAEFNFYGPRASQLSVYFAIKLKNNCLPFNLNPLIRPDLEARLNALSDISLMELKVRASFANLLEKADKDLGAALAANIKAVNARPEDEFELKFVRKKSKHLDAAFVPSSLIKAIRFLARRPELREQVSIFKVKGDGGDSRPLDILHEQFISEKHVQPALNESGGVESESMFAAIEEAYTEMESKLNVAKEIE